MPLDGRSGLGVRPHLHAHKHMRRAPSWSPLLHPGVVFRFLLVRMWIGLCRGMMWGKSSGLANGEGPGPVNWPAGYLRSAGSTPGAGRQSLLCLSFSTILHQEFLFVIYVWSNWIEVASMLAGPSWQTVLPHWSIRHRLSLLTVFLRFAI